MCMWWCVCTPLVCLLSSTGRCEVQQQARPAFTLSSPTTTAALPHGDNVINLQHNDGRLRLVQKEYALHPYAGHTLPGPAC